MQGKDIAYIQVVIASIVALLAQPIATLHSNSEWAIAQIAPQQTSPVSAPTEVSQTHNRSDAELLTIAPRTIEISTVAFAPSVLDATVGQAIAITNKDTQSRVIQIALEGGVNHPTLYLPVLAKGSVTSLMAREAGVSPVTSQESALETVTLNPGETISRIYSAANNYRISDVNNQALFTRLFITALPIAKDGSLFGKVRRFDTKALLSGAIISTLELGSSISTTTDAQGQYRMALPPGEYTLVVFANGYTFSNRKVTVQTNSPTGIDPLELVPIDPVTKEIGTQGTGGSITNSKDTTNVVVRDGAVPSAKQFRLTELPVDEFAKDFTALPGPFNNGRIPLGFVMFEPEGTKFTVPVTWTIDYTGTLPVGTYVPCFYWLEKEARWGDPVDGYVVDLGNGKKGLRAELPHFSAYGFAAPPVNPQPDGPADKGNTANNPNMPGGYCPLGSQINTLTGELCQTFATLPLPSVGHLPMQISARYHSLDASNNTGFTTQFKPRPNSGSPTRTWRYEVGGRVFTGTGSTVNVNWDGRDVNGRLLPPGMHTGRLTARSEYNTAAGWSIFETPMDYPVPIRRADLSTFGQGWFSSHDFLLVDRGDFVSLVQSSGLILQYAQTITGYQPQAGEFSTLVKNADKSYTRRMLDGSEMQFNADGRLTRISDRYGNVQVIVYESNGKEVAAGDWGLTSRIHRITDSSGNYFDYSYDGSGYLSAITDSANRVYGFEHDAAGNLTAISDPSGQREVFSYSATGIMSSHIDKRGQRTNYVLDSRGRLTSRAWPTGTTLNVTYAPTSTTILPDSGGPWVTGLDAQANPAQFFNGIYTATTLYNAQQQPEVGDVPPQTQFYDANGNLVASLGPETMRAEYAGAYAQISHLQTASGDDTTFGYDGGGNLTQMTDALGQGYTMSYDARGQLLSISDPLGNKTQLEYNAQGRVTVSKDALNRSTKMAYDAAGNLIALTDPLQQSTQLGYDRLNRVTVITDALNGQTKLTYDANGNLTQVADPTGRNITYAYDELNRPTQLGYGDGSKEQMGYDPMGNLTLWVDSRNKPVTLQYDAANRLKRKNFADSGLQVDYAYDSFDQLTLIQDAKHIVRRSFITDTTGLLSAERTDLAGQPYHSLVEYDYGSGFEGRDDYFEIHIGDVVTRNAPAPGAGVLESAAYRDIYTFTVNPGQVVYFEDRESEASYLEWDLFDSAKTLIFANYLSGNDPGLYTLTRGGVYTIAVIGNGYSGAYGFALLNAPSSKYNYTIGTVVTTNAPMAGMGVLESKGVRDIYTFNATAGQPLYFDSLGAQAYYLHWQLRGPNSTQIFDNWLGSATSPTANDPGRYVMPVTGIYTMTVFGGSYTGTYGFKVWDAPVQTFAYAIGSVITPNVPAPGAGNIETPGVFDVYTFTANAGQGVLFDVLANSEYYLGWEVRGPDNVMVIDRWLGQGDTGRVVLNKGGIYTMTLYGYVYGYTGTYAIKVWDAPAQQFDINIDDVISPNVPALGAGIIETPGTVDVYRFTGAAGQVINLNVQAYSDYYTLIQINGPTGLILSSYAGWGNSGNRTLSAAGLYTLTVGGYSNVTSTYRIRLQSVPVALASLSTDAISAMQTSVVSDLLHAEQELFRAQLDHAGISSEPADTTAAPPEEANAPFVAALSVVTVSGQIVANTTWVASSVYIIDGDLTVIPGVVLTVQAGTVVKFRNASSDLIVQGTLRISGEIDASVFFTSIHDDARGGDTDGGATVRPSYRDGGTIIFQPGSVGRLTHAFFGYGGGSGYGMIYANAADVEITYGHFVQNLYYDVYANDARVVVQNSRFADSVEEIYYYYNYYAIYNATPQQVITATYNYWGSANGPNDYQSSYYRSARVTNGVGFMPWSRVRPMLGGTRMKAIRVGANTNRQQEQRYTYDAIGQITTLRSTGYSTYSMAYVYDAAGRPTARNGTQNTAQRLSLDYDAASQLMKLAIANETTLVLQESYAYDLAGNVSAVNSSRDGQRTYTYDKLNRLTSVSSPIFNATYSYDATGNRLTAGGITYSYDAGGRVTGASDGTGYSYDLAGNLSTKSKGGQTTRYTWDERNRLVRIDYANGTFSAYTYDDVGHRLSKRTPDGSVTYFVYMGANLAQELDASGKLIASYTYDGLDRPISLWRAGNTYFYMQDRLGNVIGLMDGAGAVVATYQYDPWGNTINATGSIAQPFRFTGREYDAESGLYFYRARYYDPGVGRFVSRDPVGLLGGQNIYLYAEANPISFTDPTGFKTSCTYIVDLHRLICTNDDGVPIVDESGGYSGYKGAANIPSRQCEKNIGPIPSGQYEVGSGRNSPNTGRMTLPLTPLPGTKMCGRGDFRIHGDNKKHNHSASHGCIIMPRAVRDILNDEGGGTLDVIQDEYP